MQAIGKNIIIKAVKEEKKGSLILTTKEEQVKFWNVLSVGKEVKEISTGDIICTHQYGMHSVPDNEGCFVIQSENVYAKKHNEHGHCC